MDTVRASLARFKDVYAQLTPFERRELMRLLLRRAEVSDRQTCLRSTRSQRRKWRRPRAVHALRHQTGSPGRIRTYNLAVNSRPLYR